MPAGRPSGAHFVGQVQLMRNTFSGLGLALGLVLRQPITQIGRAHV